MIPDTVLRLCDNDWKMVLDNVALMSARTFPITHPPYLQIFFAILHICGEGSQQHIITFYGRSFPWVHFCNFHAAS